MRFVINAIPLALGAVLPEDERADAGLRRPPVWQRLLGREVMPGRRLDAANCTIEAFDGAFHLYPCTDDYLTPDRQWRTAVSIFLDGDRVRGVMVRVIEGRYAAVEFVDRFRDICTEHLGEGQAVDRFTRRWKNGQTTFMSCLQPDGKNACFSFETVD